MNDSFFETELSLDILNDHPIGKVGYCTIVGRPNTGKSTFLNCVLDYHLAAVSSKPQTTRRKWIGILSDEVSQIIFVDTPGVHSAKRALDEYMQEEISGALGEGDAVLFLIDPLRSAGEEQAMTLELVKTCGKPVVIAVNKCDEASKEQIAEAKEEVKAHFPDSGVFEISAETGDGTAAVLDALRDRLPEGPFLFAPDEITTAFERQIASEVIREACLNKLQQELPHATAVTIDTWQDSNEGTRIKATIHVERESQKGMVIGGGGRMIKGIQGEAEKNLSRYWERKVRIKLYVKVSKDWRKKRKILQDLV